MHRAIGPKRRPPAPVGCPWEEICPTKPFDGLSAGKTKRDLFGHFEPESLNILNGIHLPLVNAFQLNNMHRQRKRDWFNFNGMVVLTALHIPLGVLTYAAGGLSIIHPLLVLGVGLHLAFNKRYRIESSAL